MIARIEELLRENKTEEAATLVLGALRATPRDPHLHNALGVIRARQNRWAEAEHAYRTALLLAPLHGGAWGNLGNALTAQGLDAQAVAAQRRSVALQPGLPTPPYNLGISLAKAERHAEAVTALTEAHAMGHPQALWNRARSHLALGEWTQGFADYEVRVENRMVPPRPRPGTRWQGENFAGRTLLLLTEQGFGDTLWVLRYLPLVRARGGRVVMEAKAELAALVAPHVETVVPPGTAEVGADLHAYVCSLPGLFPGIPSLPPLTPDPVRVAALAPRIAGPALKVGIIWSGSVTFGSNHWRAVGLGRFLRLGRLPGIRLFSLQKGPPEAELAQHPEGAGVTALGPLLHDFADTAAALSLLDLVVMTDSAVAHLAGAMGRPCWVLLGRAPHWLWLTGREDSPWYPSLRLFRMAPGPLEWEGVFDHAGAALMALVAGTSATAPPG